MATKKKGALCGGSYITRLAKNINVFKGLSNLTPKLKMIPLNIDVMKKVVMVRRQGSKYVLVRQVEEEPPAQQDEGQEVAQPEL